MRTELRKEADTSLSPVEVGAGAPATSQLETVLASLDDSKAENIVAIDIRKKSSLGDHMVVASGRSHRHVAAVADHLMKALKDSGVSNTRVEGLPGADWVLIDTSDIIIHVFRPEVREFYNLEKMWQAPDLDDGTKH
ncbi:ribosome silencing factor [Tianweitania sp. BSSL-BM11]|uniref:Ribosomal silencing factor RsfS n=1 Tax=Tianweitania aestuarii TaxID=2814886 RepID=A0ABS5RWV3_9HYPH|nr:ribosome silencing factor [Tianweitania aestuarii]MBS9721538.1 ribosome silencing factor [Tianweitania aestuarii]